MTAIPTEGDLAEILRDLQALQALGDLVKVSGLSEGTVYRHARPAGAKNRPGSMGRRTVRQLTVLFGGLGLLDGYSREELIAAAERLRVLARAEPQGGDEDLDLVEGTDDATRDAG